MPTAEQKTAEENARILAEAFDCGDVRVEEESRAVYFVARKKGQLLLGHPVAIRLTYEQFGAFLGGFLPMAMKPAVVAAPGPSSTPRFQ